MLPFGRTRIDVTLSCGVPWYDPASPITCATAPLAIPASWWSCSSQNGAVLMLPLAFPRVSVANDLPSLVERSSTSWTRKGSWTRAPGARVFRSIISSSHRVQRHGQALLGNPETPKNSVDDLRSLLDARFGVLGFPRPTVP